MASTFSLAPSPKWYFFDSFGQLAVGGTLETFSSLDHSTPKFVFSDAAGLFPYTDPILLDGTGGTPVPMYWEDNGVDLYYVVIRDASGNIILTIDNFPTPGGGVTPITSNVDIENHLINGQFLFIDAVNETLSVVSPVPIGETRVAPGSGFYKDGSGEYVISLAGGGNVGWIFQKNGGAGATDSIRFVEVLAIGAGFPNEPSANATRFFRYQFSIAGAAVTEASLGLVIPNVERFSGETITVSFDSRSNVLGAQGVFRFEQNFGTGGVPSVTVVTSQIFTFSNPGFARQSFTLLVPSVVGKNKGTNLDDHIYIAWQFPFNTIGSFDLANLQVQRGVFGLMPYIQQTYAQDQYKVLIDLIYNGNIVFRTGELKWMAAQAGGGEPLVIPGWLFMRDKTLAFIGSAASVAVNRGLQFRNLYVLWWNSYPQTECIVSGGRGVSALADFNANKTMTIPQHILGTVAAAAGNGIISAAFGTFEGERTHTLDITEIPSHTHLVNAQFVDVTVSTGAGNAVPRGNVNQNSGATGGGFPHNNMQPTFYMWVYVKI